MIIKVKMKMFNSRRKSGWFAKGSNEFQFFEDGQITKKIKVIEQSEGHFRLLLTTHDEEKVLEDDFNNRSEARGKMLSLVQKSKKTEDDEEA